MGWQDGDWATLSESETVTICGDGDDSLEPVDWSGGSFGPPKRRRFDLLRILIWSLTAVIAVILLGTAKAGWGRSNPSGQANQVAYPLGVVFGNRGTNTTTPYGPGGSESICTDEAYDSSSGDWQCKTWNIDSVGLPISTAVPYDGQCAEMQADQSTGKWTCVSGSSQQPATTAQ